MTDGLPAGLQKALAPTTYQVGETVNSAALLRERIALAIEACAEVVATKSTDYAGSFVGSFNEGKYVVLHDTANELRGLAARVRQGEGT